MSRGYAGLWRALLLVEPHDEYGPTGPTEYVPTEPPAPYEDVERWLWHIAEAGLPVEGKRVKKALMVEVGA